MFKLLASTVMLSVLSEAVTAGIEAFSASRAARRAEKAKGSTASFTADGDLQEAILVPFRVTVAVSFLDGSRGMTVHEIYAEDSNSAYSWALKQYVGSGLEHPRVIIEAL